LYLRLDEIQSQIQSPFQNLSLPQQHWGACLLVG
jgi:hypothetical protein